MGLVQKVGGALSSSGTSAGGLGGMLGGLADKFNVAARLGGQLTKGGFPMNGKVATPTAGAKVAQGPVYLENDWRVTLQFTPGVAELLKNQSAGDVNLLAPLFYYKSQGNDAYNPVIDPNMTGTNNGIVFPYTPQINVTYSAEYQSQKFTHSNYAAQFYSSSEIQDIQIQGEFTAQNETEARYLLAVITFTKLVTKMFFGNGPNVGNPPPILKFSGFGPYQFNKVPVVVKQANFTLPAEVDYIPVNSVSGQLIARVPTQMSVSYTVAPVYSRNTVGGFDFTKFANGDLINGKGFV
jgi:hypothetical protein